MLLGILSASLLGKQRVIATSQRRGVYRDGKGKGIVRAGYGHPSQNNSNNNKMHF